MSLLSSIFLVLGGQATLLLVLWWLARSLVSQLLAKDLGKFTEDLAVTSQHLTHDLQLAALEHQVRFSKLHERRAEVVAELYSLLVEAQWASQSFSSLFEGANEPSKKEKYIMAQTKLVDFYRYFDKNRIYLPEILCNQLEQFNKGMRSKVDSFGLYVNFGNWDAIPNFVVKKFEEWKSASEYFDTEVPRARIALETEFRSILGVNTPSASANFMD